jgi:multidrug efflux system membrane fusion protein
MRISKVWIVLLLAGAVATSACSAGSDASAQQQPAQGGRGGRGTAQGAVPVTVAGVVQKPLALDVQAIGTVIAASTVAMHAQITGELTSVNFKEGDDVQQGQVLFTLDRRPLDAALHQAEANLARDEAQAVNARAQSARYQDLMRRGIATREQVDQMTSNAAALEATLGADQAALENAKVQLDYATITAPISGRTGLLQVHKGNLVRANDTIPIVVINRITPVYVSFAIAESMLPDFKRYLARETVRVEARAPTDSGAPSLGKIDFIDNAVDPMTGTIKIKGTFPNTDRRLWPGQYVNVTVTLATEPNALVVPSPAVQTGQQGTYVYVVKPDQTADLRTVTVERTRGDETVIKSGVQAGETVVTDGQLRLVPGAKVSVKSGNGSRVAP